MAQHYPLLHVCRVAALDMIDPVTHLVLTLFIALLWVTSGMQKCLDPGRFAQVVTTYRLIPTRLVWAACWILAGAEVVLGIAMVVAAGAALGSARLLAASASLGSAFLLTFYAAAMGINIRRGRAQIECGCSLRPGPTLGPALVIRNLLLAGAALIVLLPVGSRSLTVFDLFQAGAATAALGLFYLTAETLLSNSRFARGTSHG
jgi:uncharacterized membrane protein YphA (DoxX/SURF4 family)